MATEIEIILDAAASEGWTQSEITTFDNCPRLWYWRYGLLLKKIGRFSWPLVYGHAFHGTLEDMYATQGKRWQPRPIDIPKGIVPNSDHLREKEYWTEVLAVQTRCYAYYYRDDFQVFDIKHLEQKVDFYWKEEGIRLRGMIDLTLANKGEDFGWILDHKTSKTLDLKTVQGWDFRFQFMFYVWLYLKANPTEQIRGFYANGIKKPTIRVKQGESLPAFLGRLEGEMMAEPEKYYYRERLILTKESLDHFEEEVLAPKIQRIKLLTNRETPAIIKDSLVKNMNTDYCQRYGGVCEYLPLCQHGYALESFQYTQRSSKHEELEEEGE